jgi:L-fuconolactonase
MAYVYRGGDYRSPAELAEWLARALPEEVLEPDLPITDCHQHLWDGDRGRYMMDELRADLASGHRIEKTIFEECRAMYRTSGPDEMRPVGEVEFVRRIAEESAASGRDRTRIAAGMVAHADLRLGARVRPVLEAEKEAGGALVRGIRFSMTWDPHEEISRYVSSKVEPGRLLDATFREGVAEVARAGLVFDVWIYFTQIPELTALARALPDARIVLNHCGGPICVGPYAADRARYREIWAQHMRDLAGCPNVHVKLGGLGMLHFGFDFHLRSRPPGSAELAEAWRPYIETCIELFGHRRAMFESNFPPDKQSCGYRAIWNAFKRIAATASPEEKQFLFSRAADEIYGLA